MRNPATTISGGDIMLLPGSNHLVIYSVEASSVVSAFYHTRVQTEESSAQFQHPGYVARIHTYTDAFPGWSLPDPGATG